MLSRCLIYLLSTLFFAPLVLNAEASQEELTDYLTRIKENVSAEEWETVSKEIEKETAPEEKCVLARKLWLEKAEEKLREKFPDLYSEKGNKERSSRILPWRTMKENIDYFWSPECKQRLNGMISLSKAVQALNDFEKLKNKFEDSSDPLLDLAKYKDLLLIPGYSGKLYWMAERLFWKGEYDRAKEGFEFFLLPENGDGFTKGAAHFFLGRMSIERPYEKTWYPSAELAKEGALDHLLRVNQYPTCLTYISYSYIFAARVYNELRYPKQALALIMVDVPSIDWKFMKYRRHWDGADYSLELGDETNSVRHLAESYRHSEKDEELFKRRIADEEISKEFWDCCATNLFTPYDLFSAIDKAMAGEESFPQEELFYEAVTHKWPDINTIPEAIATNRVLNNNIFSLPERK